MVAVPAETRSKRSGGSLNPILYDCIPPGELVPEFTKRSKPITLASDCVLFREGDAPKGVYLLRKGTATLTMRLADRIVMHAHAATGSLLGLPSTFSGKPYTMTATVSPDAEVEHLSPEGFRELIASSPGLCVHVVQILAAEVRSVRKALAELVFESEL